jgi:hypothetical protein
MTLSNVNDYIKEINNITNKLRMDKKQIVEVFSIPQTKDTVDKGLWKRLIDLYEVDPTQNPYSWYFLSAAKFILLQYLKMLQIQIT